MGLTLHYLSNALEDLRSLHNYLSKNDSAQASQVMDCLRQQHLQLAEGDIVGKPSHLPNLFELPCQSHPYMTIYRTRDEALEILAVVHVSRQWPN